MSYPSHPSYQSYPFYGESKETSKRMTEENEE